MKEKSLIFQYNEGGLAAAYRTHALAYKEQDDPTRTRIVQWLSTCNRAATLLDAGCGGGAGLTTYRAMGFRHLIGLDASIDQCLLTAQLHQVAIPVLCADMQRIPLKTAQVDLVASRYGIHYCQDVQAAVSEMARVIKPDGLYMGVIGHPDYDASRTDKHNGDGTISYTLFGGAMPITYYLHPMEAYVGSVFQRYFTMIASYADPSPTLDDVKPQDRPAFCFLARRNARPFPAV